jgi:hypothetical protein
LLKAGLFSSACLAGVALAAWAMGLSAWWWPHAAPSFAEQPPAVGEAAPDFTLREADGHLFRLREHLGREPVILEFVSFT